MSVKITLPAAAAALCLGLLACSPDEPERAGTPPAAGTASWTTADGNRMPYTDRGEGLATVVLVHCWMCDRSFWSEQIPVLARRYRSIAVDLPGHGEATAERTVWTVSGYGDDVAGMIEGMGLQNVVLIGHSMGGPVSLRAAALAGDRVRGIVAVDTLHDVEFEFNNAQMEEYMAAFEADFAGTCSAFVDSMFPEEGVEDVVTRVRDTGCRAENGGIASALMRDFGVIDMPRWMSEAGVPIRAVNAATPYETRVETNRKYADFDVAVMDGVGHYPHMTRPEAFNPLLLEAIAGILSATE